MARSCVARAEFCGLILGDYTVRVSFGGDQQRDCPFGIFKTRLASDLIVTGMTQRPNLALERVGNYVRIAWPASPAKFYRLRE